MASDFVTQAELEAALEALREPGRFQAAERLVAQAAPGLHRLLLEALASGGWNTDDDAREVDKALAEASPEAVRIAVRTLVAEQTRIAMLVGVAVGIELAAELDLHGEAPAAPLPITQHRTTEGNA